MACLQARFQALQWGAPSEGKHPRADQRSVGSAAAYTAHLDPTTPRFNEPQAPLLESLKLGRQQVLTSLGAGALARLRHLDRLDLSGCCQTSEATLALALGSLHNLREADLSMCAQLGDATLSMLAASCPQLSRLDLTSCERFR